MLGLEVALLVEHAVVRQQALAIDGSDAAVRADEARVVEAAVLGVRRPDERDDARGRLRHPTGSLRSRVRRTRDGAGGPPADSP